MKLQHSWNAAALTSCSYRLTSLPCGNAEARRIAPAAFEMLAQHAEGCEELGDADICSLCLTARMQGYADAHTGSQQREAILEILDAMDAEAEERDLNPPGPQDYYVSKLWLL